MPETSPEVAALTARFVADVEALIQETAAAQLQAALDEIQATLLGTAATANVMVAPTPPTAPRVRAKRVCPVPGCGKLAAGPRYRWRCREHGAPPPVPHQLAAPVPSRPVAQPASVSAVAVVLPQPKTATVIPPGIQITRLPPGPVPKERRTQSGPAVMCRLPGCTERHSGPRYDLFCRDHYGALNADQRFQYRELWRSQPTTK